jgi:hypothetical protein
MLKLESEQPVAKINWPARIAVEKANSITRAPNRSTSTPPKNGSRMLGIEYNVYSRFYRHNTSIAGSVFHHQLFVERTKRNS